MRMRKNLAALKLVTILTGVPITCCCMNCTTNSNELSHIHGSI